MRALLLFSLGLGTSAISFGQSFQFPDSGATWVNTLYWIEPFPPPATFTLQAVDNYCANGEDTLINAELYTKLKYCSGDYKGAFRDDAGVVWYIPADSLQEYLLYDFTLSAGDTAHNVYWEQGLSGSGSLSTIVVNDVQIDIMIEGRKVISLGSGAQWIEGIGAHFGLFSEPWSNVSNYALRLECMSYTDTIRYPDHQFTSGACALDTEVPSKLKASMTVFPNPTDGPLHLTWDGADFGADLQLFTADGRSIPVQATWGGTTATIDIGPMAPGLYFVRCARTVRPIVRR